ncbi:hypothetical protein CCY99_03740 [Helicobacter sp. 16-1353]|uniref:superinfection immunity protein n=1 Tax=Helicobacter sp. 16-1353 TaxID=2004996 RepID=UPI000DCBA1EC|nr:superinfection immunity protein [Helicobacter sp. 16-1353]RAX54472.1 hypothetical protein CCY99_03740 [Helicobacter sp. 16-1353]
MAKSLKVILILFLGLIVTGVIFAIVFDDVFEYMIFRDSTLHSSAVGIAQFFWMLEYRLENMFYDVVRSISAIPYVEFMIIVIAGLIYIIPSLIATIKGHSKQNYIIGLNLIAGWSIIGWIVALVWSMRDENSNFALA